MKYPNGREIAIGDTIVAFESGASGPPTFGVVESIDAKADVITFVPIIAVRPASSLNCVHVDDVKSAGRIET